MDDQLYVSISKDMKRKFKAWCSMKGYKMSDVIKVFIQLVLEEDKNTLKKVEYRLQEEGFKKLIEPSEEWR